MRTKSTLLTLAASPAVALSAPAYALVPAAERLSFSDVFADAGAPVQAMMALLILGAVTSPVVWALALPQVGKADAKGLARSLGWLRIVRSAAALLGFFAASYTLLAMFLGIANTRPAPSLTLLAPGFAEATLAVMLGLLAATLAVIAERHLEARVRRAAA